jgi:hypothetical protein
MRLRPRRAADASGIAEARAERRGQGARPGDAVGWRGCGARERSTGIAKPDAPTTPPSLWARNTATVLILEGFWAALRNSI